MSERDYKLVIARQRLLPLDPDAAREADRLIASSVDAAEFARNLDASLRSTAETHLRSVIFGKARAREERRQAIVRVRFADGQRKVVTGQPGREFQQLIKSLKTNATALASGVDCSFLSYTKKLGARRDAIAKCDLLVVDASTFLSLRRRATNALYEIAWARYFEKPIIWACMGEEVESSKGVAYRITRVMKSLAVENYHPMYKMSFFRGKQPKLDRYYQEGQSPVSLDRRFLPDDYSALFAEERLTLDIWGEVVEFGLPQVRAQILQFCGKRGDFWSCWEAGIRARTSEQTRARAV